MIKTRLRKIATLILTATLFFSGNVITAAAQEQTGTEMQEEIVMPQIIGDSVVIFDNGTEKWSIKLISEQESKTRATNRVAEKVYVFEHEVFFVTVDAFKVTLRCDWTEDGDNSKINNLHGEYEILNSLFSCEWIGSSALETSHSLDLKGSYKFGDDMQIRFSANILYNTPMSIYFATYHIL